MDAAHISTEYIITAVYPGLRRIRGFDVHQTASGLSEEDKVQETLE